PRRLPGRGERRLPGLARGEGLREAQGSGKRKRFSSLPSMSQSISPLAPPSTGPLPVIRGVSLAVAETGIRYKNRPDVMLAVLGSGTTVAGTFTASKTRSAPVDWCIEALAGGSARAVVVNSGNANAFT